MHGLIMDYQLTVPTMLRRAEQLFQDKRVVSRRPDKHLDRRDYAELIDRIKRLAVALGKLGVKAGDRVGTLCWNHAEHLEAYFGIPSAGAVLHTLNLRLHPSDLAFIAGHAGDRVVLVDDVLWPLFEQFRDEVPFQHIVVIRTAGQALPKGTIDYEELLAEADPARFEYPDFDERLAATMCYTSGTTGKPKGVLASHRAVVLHSLGTTMADTQALSEHDTVLPVVPMFHANAWGLPFAALMVGANHVFPGPHLDPPSLVELFAGEHVTVTAGVPTIWMGILQLLDQAPEKYDLSSLRALLVGGSAAPISMIRGFQERHGLRVLHAWGMTELCPLGTVSQLSTAMRSASADEQYAYRAKQGRPVPLVEIRARGDNGIVPWDGRSVGELEVRGPWIAASYFNCPEGAASFTDDGWFRTGDIVAISPDGSMQLQDRAKDVIKSGGEWISSVALENALMGHPAVAEAAVIPCAHPRWDERPLAVVVLKSGAKATYDELREYLAPKFAKWWLPDAVVFAREIPRTSAGKFLKTSLREQYRDYYKCGEQAATT
ncbi:MAG: long-chain fatty acid--CoA ligase [Pirellulales bacterium]|nr:long-chain fatty acid--CoA ligase [Pirellulales bacterium]